MNDCDSISEDLQKDQCFQEEVITTREEISLDL